MTEEYEIIDVSAWPKRDWEPGGEDEKVWLQDPRGAEADQDHGIGRDNTETVLTSRDWLFKPVVEKDGRRQGEDWAEKITSEVAALMRVPSAPIELAVRTEAGKTRHGSISRDVRPGHPSEWQDYPGAVLLGEIVPNFDSKDPLRRGHTLLNIMNVLGGCGSPPLFDGPPTFSAFDVFCGYLLLDACVANTDRHSENWSVLVAADGTRSLMASYDHASSFGFGLTDEKREHILGNDKLFHRWSQRGFAQRFEGGKKITLVEHAHSALAMVDGRVRQFWLDQLERTTPDKVDAILARVPTMSQVARTFCGRLFRINRERLLS